MTSATVPEALDVAADVAAVEARLAEMYAAWTARDEPRIRRLFSHRPDLKLWGTDAFERIVGRDEADELFRTWIATCPPWISIAPDHRSFGVVGDLAWAADDVTARWRAGGQAGEARYRCTTVWQRVDGEWYVVHSNFAAGE
ncbi:MAG: nuclear transport factor 2 family protein [Thermomicrobiales bacterium]